MVRGAVRIVARISDSLAAMDAVISPSAASSRVERCYWGGGVAGSSIVEEDFLFDPSLRCHLLALYVLSSF